MSKKKPRDLPRRQPIEATDASTTKATIDTSTSPFATFVEWAGEADEQAYKTL